MSKIGDIFLHNLSLKIGAVFFATLLWFHTITEKTYEYNFEVSKTDIKLPRGYQLVDSEIPNVIVRLSGTGKSLLECFDKNALVLDIDLTGRNPGQFEYPVDASNIRLPDTERLSVVEVVFPHFIHMQLVKKQT